jgi:hypothetical protein
LERQNGATQFDVSSATRWLAWLAKKMMADGQRTLAANAIPVHWISERWSAYLLTVMALHLPIA